MAVTFNFRDMLSRSSDVEFDDLTLASVASSLPPLSKDGPWLAGGALRRTLLGQEPESDFDFFFRDADQLMAFRLKIEAMGLEKIRETEHHVHFRGVLAGSSLPRDIQLIRFSFYKDAEAVIDSFDFTICQFAFDGEMLTVGDYALWDLGRKRLAVHKLTYPVASMRRLLKYAKQGFKACNGALTAILRETASSPELLAALNIAYVD